ncbi:hypothetical protein SK128_017697, partial [Halocaridina rubra]
AEAAAYSLPPPLTPNITATRDSSSNFSQLLKFLQDSKQYRLHQDDLRRREEN